MELTPDKIRGIYRSTPPYQVEELMQTYLGEQISWVLKLNSIIKLHTGNLRPHLYFGSHAIKCEIGDNDFSQIKTLLKDTELRLSGHIEAIDSFFITIGAPKFSLL